MTCSPPTVVPPHVLALDLGAYDMELDPDAMGDSVACICAVSSPAGVDVPSVVVLVASVRGLKLVAAAAAAGGAGTADDVEAGACFSRVYDCHDLRRSRPDVASAA